MWGRRRKDKVEYEVEVVWLGEEPPTCADIGAVCQPRPVITRHGVKLQCPVCDLESEEVWEDKVATKESRRLLKKFK